MNRHAQALVALLAFVAMGALAQGGPPLVTDDPGTPGAGKWEINVAAIATRAPGRWEIDAPHLDLNYGLGSRIQLKLEAPWVFVRDSGESWKSGLGRGNAGVKWRFIGDDDSKFSMSTYPQYTWNILSSSARRGLTEPGHEFLLPVELATKLGGVAVDFEAGRNFVSDGPNEWVAGAVVAPQCSEKVQCLFEVHETWSHDEHATLVNVGMRWKVRESMSLLAAIGHEFGTASDDKRRLLAYLGVQFRR